MPRPTFMTKQDRDFMNLRDQVRLKVKSPRAWKHFKEYMDSYYTKLPSHITKK